MTKKKVVVIGGSGFIGSHTADELSRQGYQVTIFDQNESPWLKPDQEMIVGDMLDRNTVSTALKDASIVYHFAGISDLEEAFTRPFDTIHLNVMGATVAADVAAKARELFLSPKTPRLEVLMRAKGSKEAVPETAITEVKQFKNQIGGG